MALRSQFARLDRLRTLGKPGKILGRRVKMSNGPVRIDVTAEEFGQLVQLAQNILAAAQGGQTGSRPEGPLTTVHERCESHWPRATAKHRQRITEAAVGRHLEKLGRRPGKQTGNPNGAFVFEEEHLWILDDAIIAVRNEEDEKSQSPLFPH
jgi:hypothetical protein